tara:strand:+ start:123 stop:347 length:225 start_codon:yes stop_codon:yes gene_type:complete
MSTHSPAPDAIDRLTVESNMVDPDGFYEKLLALHQGLDEQQSAQLNARLVLVLANHIGSAAVLDEAFALARRHL